MIRLPTGSHAGPDKSADDGCCQIRGFGYVLVFAKQHKTTLRSRMLLQRLTFTFRSKGVLSMNSADSLGTLHRPARTARPRPTAAAFWPSLTLQACIIHIDTETGTPPVPVMCSSCRFGTHTSWILRGQSSRERNVDPTASCIESITCSLPAGSSLVASNRPTNLQHAHDAIEA